MSDPLSNVENAHAMFGLGATAVQIYRGAREEADSKADAFWATVAAITALLRPESTE